MVNTGKPSTGCYMCRSRRIKCDEAKPHCMRCQKSKRICPGYRDAFELNLRDETKSIKKKASRVLVQHTTSLNAEDASDESLSKFALEVCPTATQPPDWIHYATLSPESTNRSFKYSRNSPASIFTQFAIPVMDQHNSIMQHLSVPVDQQATCFFLSNFVLIPEEGTMRGYLDYLVPLLKAPKPDPSLILAFSAVAFAALGSRPSSRSLLPKADDFYIKALKQINWALKDPKLAAADATLAAVMLLSVFEQLTSSRLNVNGWASHIDGAVALIKSRGKNQFQTRLGRDLGIAVRAHMTIGCIANSKAVEYGTDWWTEIEAYDEVTQAFARLNLKVADLRMETDKTTTLQTHMPSNIEKVLKLLRQAEALDQQYVEWRETLPPAWEIKPISWVDVTEVDLTISVVHPGRVDSYGELWMAYTYNVARASRIFIQTTILRCVAWLSNPHDYRITPEYTTASRICGHLIEDIVASVPCFFGWSDPNDICLTDRSNFACGTNDRSSSKSLGGVFAMWPLFAAASSDFATPSQRTFLRGRLKYIAETMGINQASVMLNAPLRHPSRYIERERIILRPTSCHDPVPPPQVPFSPEGLAKVVFSPPSCVPIKDSSWTPRAMEETTTFFQDTIR